MQQLTSEETRKVKRFKVMTFLGRFFFPSLFSLFVGFWQAFPTTYTIVGHSLNDDVTKALKFSLCDT